MSDNPIAKLGDLSKPATTLIEKISEAVGGVFKPYQIVRVAKAEADADRIRAQSQIEVTDLQRRAMHRFLVEEAKRQSNIESITQKAIPQLEEKSDPGKVEDDWITNFFDKSRIVSDKEMQQLWAALLAGEANSPGAFSKRTVNLLSDLDKSDAELFARLCCFGWNLAGVAPLVFDVLAPIYAAEGISFASLSHLETLGLIQFDNTAGFVFLELPKRVEVNYFGKVAQITFPQESGNRFDVGKVLLTKAGQQLARVCTVAPIAGFYEYVYDRWAKQNLVQRNTEQTVPTDRA